MSYHLKRSWVSTKAGHVRNCNNIPASSLPIDWNSRRSLNEVTCFFKFVHYFKIIGRPLSRYRLYSLEQKFFINARAVIIVSTFLAKNTKDLTHRRTFQCDRENCNAKSSAFISLSQTYFYDHPPPSIYLSASHAIYCSQKIHE